MREYIHLFENSDLRDTYEYGSDYTEPYVSYTPVINKYEAQFNGETAPISLSVKKSGNLYQISSDNIDLIDVNDNIIPFVSVESNSFYLETSDLPDSMFIFPEDLNLTEESTEFTFNGITYSIELGDTNIWSVTGRNPDEGLYFNNIVKIDIVSVPSSNTDFVHYNKITPEKITAKFIVVNDQSTLSRKITSDSRLLEQIYINGTPILEEEIPTRLIGLTSYSVYHTFEEEGTYDIEYVLKEEYVGTIPAGLFPDYQKFSEIIIPKGVTTIESEAFYFINNYPYNTNPEINVIIPNTITQVEDEAVRCSSINSSTIQKFISINPNSVSMSACEK